MALPPRDRKHRRAWPGTYSTPSRRTSIACVARPASARRNWARVPASRWPTSRATRAPIETLASRPWRVSRTRSTCGSPSCSKRRLTDYLAAASAQLLGQSDNDALRATQEAESVDVLVLRDLADEFGTVAAQAGNDVVQVIDSEHDAAHAQRVGRRALRLGSDGRRPVELRQLNPAVAVRGPHHGDVGTDVVEPDGLVHPRPLHRRLAFQLHTQLGEERFGGLEVLDDDEHVVHSLDRHIRGA